MINFSPKKAFKSANFLKLIFFAIFLIGGFFAFKYSNSQNPSAQNLAQNTKEMAREFIDTQDLKPLACDLNTKACEYEFQGRLVRVELKNKPLRAMQENEIIISNLGSFKDLNAKIYALNMYMGEISSSFQALNENEYSAKVIFSACVMDLMRYRIKFFNANKPLGFYFDVDMKQNANKK